MTERKKEFDTFPIKLGVGALMVLLALPWLLGLGFKYMDWVQNIVKGL